MPNILSTVSLKKAPKLSVIPVVLSITGRTSMTNPFWTMARLAMFGLAFGWYTNHTFIAAFHTETSPKQEMALAEVFKHLKELEPAPPATSHRMQPAPAQTEEIPLPRFTPRQISEGLSYEPPDIYSKGFSVTRRSLTDDMENLLATR
jgi:hypothetical protein